ncbi:MAG: carbohydrate ABC transporter permease [Propionicimonas sp.]|nr:carbohydrate ABC transporter permease [Propionicimonas sp.]
MRTSKAETILNYTALVVLAVAVLFPVATFVSAALSPDRSGLAVPGVWAWENFATAWQGAKLARARSVSVTICVVAVILQLTLGILGGYGFGVLNAVGSKWLYPLVLLGLMVSIEAIIVPLYYQMRDLGLTNSIPGLILIHVGTGVPFGVFWMRAAFRSLPRSLFEAAHIDGAGTFRMLLQVALPLVKPAILTYALLGFMWTWNDYFLSLIFLTGDNQTATVALGAFQGKFLTEYNLMAAGGLIVAAPVLILYIIFQRRFIAGMLAGALKE